MSTTGPSNLTPPVPPPVTIDQVCDALDEAGFDSLEEFPQGTTPKGAYLLVSEADLRVVDFGGNSHHVSVDEDGCACIGSDAIDNVDELKRLATAWSKSEEETER